MLTCRDVAEQASAYLDRDLPRGRRMAIRLHLWMCGHCRDFMERFQYGVKLVQGLAGMPVEPSPRLLAVLEEHANARAAGERRGAGPGLEPPPGMATARTGAQHSGDSAPSAQSRAKAPRLRVIEGDGGNGSVARVFREIEEAFGAVPNLFRAYAHHPEVLESTWGRVKAIMLQGSLPRRLKESIAVMISSDNGCRYCVDYHSNMLRSLGVTDDEIQRLLRDPLAGRFEPKERALLALARQANADPHGASDEQLDVARRAGASDAEIIEALAVMELFTSFNRFLNTFNIAETGV